MIERGHEHMLRPASRQDLPDGRRIVHSVCVCSLEEQRVTAGEVVTGLKFRYGGLWFAPLDLVRISATIGVIECEACGGVAGVTPCETCGGLGVTNADGTRLEPRALKVG
jgi:hypothetical protein